MAKNFFRNLFGNKDEKLSGNQKGGPETEDARAPSNEHRANEPSPEEMPPSPAAEPVAPPQNVTPSVDPPHPTESTGSPEPTETFARDIERSALEEIAAPQEAQGETSLSDSQSQYPIQPIGESASESMPTPEPPQGILPEAPVTAEDATEEGAAEPEKKGWLSRLKTGLNRTSTKLSDGVTSIFTKRKLDDETLEELEDLLITSDLGVATAAKVTAELARDKFDKEVSENDVKQALAKIVAQTLSPVARPLEIDASRKPHVILMTGVNGAGKTTTIGKLALKFQKEGRSVMLAAGDTFRAAAIEQLQVWGERTGAPVISRPVGSDAAGLAFDALKEAQARNIDVLLIDTAGRLQNRTELMDELAKIVRVVRKVDESAPHDTLLVLDATVGQNAISQAETFKAIAEVTGLVMTKLDGTARGGVLVALAEKFGLPIHFIGVGEAVDDLQPFDAAAFSRALAGLVSTKD